MEKEKTEVKQDKTKKIQIGSNGGGNIGGLVLLGGALAVGSLVAILAARKGRRRKDSDNKRSSCMEKQDQQSQSQQSILQTPSPTFHDNQCCAINGSMEIVSADNLMLEEDPASVVNKSHKNSENNDQEIVLSHDLRQDSIEMCDNHCFAEEIQSPELNIISLDELDKHAKNDEASIEVADEDEIDAVKMSTEEISSVDSIVEEDGHGKEEKKQEKGLFLLEEIIEFAEKEEQTTVEICAEIEDSGENFEKESALMEMIEVKQEEAMHKVEEEDAIDALKISTVEIPSEKSIDDDDDSKEESKQAKEKLFLEENIEVEEEEPIGVKSCEEITALSIIEKEDGDDDFKKGLPLMKDIELKQEPINEVGEDSAMEENLSINATKGDDEEAEKRHSIDEKEERDNDFNKTKHNYGGTEIWTENNMINAQLSEEKTTESDESNKTKDFDQFNCSKKDNIDSSTFSRKEENLHYVVWTKRAVMNLRKWKIPFEHILIKASIVLLFLVAMHCLFYLLCNNIVIR